MKRSKHSQPCGRKPTFAEQLESLAAGSADRAFSRAAEMSDLAKAASGAMRKALYRRKHEVLRRLVDRGLVEVAIDGDREIGLLSVKSPGGRRLHTSDAWLSGGR